MAQTKTVKYFRYLKLFHRNLHGLFARHQKALKGSKPNKAMKYFENYFNAQHAHIEKEEKSIFPFFKEDMKLPGFDFLLEEHRKASEALLLIRVLLHKWVMSKGEGNAERALRKTEASFKKFIYAHERKEEKIFFPRIEKALKKEEQGGRA